MTTGVNKTSLPRKMRTGKSPGGYKIVHFELPSALRAAMFRQASEWISALGATKSQIRNWQYIRVECVYIHCLIVATAALLKQNDPPVTVVNRRRRVKGWSGDYVKCKTRVSV